MNKANESLNVWANSLPSGSWCSTKDSNIKFEEQKSKITFVNKSKKSCLKVDVDGGVIPSNTRSARCDKLLVEKSAPLFCFVELKGGDIEHAIEQLEASLKNPKLNPECSQRKLALVVGKNHFPASSPLIQKGMKKISSLNARLIVANTPASYSL